MDINRLRTSSGFTLIELLVVILIIGVLVAVAAPSFLGQTHKAHDSAAKQYLAIAYREAAAASVEHDGDFGGPTAGPAAAQVIADAINASEGGLLLAEPGSCPADATADQRYIVVDEDYTGGGNLRLCNDPEHTVWTLTVTNHVLQGFNSEVRPGTGIAAPKGSGAPTLSGPPQVNHLLSVSSGSWANNPTAFSYTWQRADDASFTTNVVTLDDGTSSYTPVLADLGKYLRATVQAENEGGVAVQSSAVSAAVLPDVPLNTEAPLVTDADKPAGAVDHVQVGDHLSTSQGTWSNDPTAFSYTWQRSVDGLNWLDAPNGNIASATSSSYTASSADAGYYLRAVVQATNSGGSSATGSNVTGNPVFEASPVNDTAPVLSDSPNSLAHVQSGDTLSVSQGSWTSAGALGYSYTWQRSTDQSAWATVGTDAASYVVQTSDIGYYFRVSVQATNSGGAASAFSNASSAPAGSANDTPPVISDADNPLSAPQVGDHLSTTTGSWSSTASGFSYQWQSSTDGFTTVSNIGTDASTYVIQAADLNKQIRVAVQATTPGGAESVFSSNQGAAAAASNPSSTAPPTFSGTAQEDQTLTKTSDGTWSAVSSLSYAYQWQRCTDASSTASCSAISGATATTYLQTSADIGDYMRLRVTATDSFGQSGAAFSDAGIQVISAAPALLSAPSVSDGGPGTISAPYVGDTLSTDNGSWTQSPTSYSYQWLRAGSAISGATSASYTLASADIGAVITVQVTAHNAGGTSSPATGTPASGTVRSLPPSNTTSPTESGTAQPSSTLTGTAGSWSGVPTPTLTYNWQRCNSAGASCADIAGATALTYTLSATDGGSTYRFAVTGTNLGGSSTAYSTVSAVAPTLVASGGTVTTSGTDKIHTFTSTGTFTISAGQGTATVLIVAGGGGGSTNNGGGGGGGAGGLVYNSYTLSPGSYTVTVGGGGGAGGAGANSSVTGLATAIGGGNGGGGSGGSGGGGNYNSGAGAGTSGQGHNGGGGSQSGCGWQVAGGGGGAGAAGTTGGQSTSPSGGNGIAYSISGSTVYYAGGGGGGAKCPFHSGGGGGAGGGGGGAANNSSGGWVAGSAGSANTGGGGGGAGGGSGSGYAGGSGIVIIRYQAS